MVAKYTTYFEIMNIVIFISWTVTTIFSLTTIIVIISRWRNGCRSVLNLLTCNSCFGLLFHVASSSIQSPSYTRNIYADQPYVDPTVCRIFGCLGTCSAAVMAFSFVIQGISRFFITIPHQYRFFTTYRFNWILILFNWLASGVIAGGFFISSDAYQFEVESHICTITVHNFVTAFTFSAIVIIFNFGTLCVIYGVIFYRTSNHANTSLISSSRFRYKRNLHVFKRILMFVNIFNFGSLPFLLTLILNYFDVAPWPLYLLVYSCLICATATNAVTIFFTNDQVKNILLKKWKDYQSNRPTIFRRFLQNRVVPLSQ